MQFDYKVCASRKNTLNSMKYIKESSKITRSAEVKLPQWKLKLFLFLCCCLFNLKAEASVELRIRHAIETEINHYSQRIGGPRQPKHAIELKLPSSLEQRGSCKNLKVSRANQEQAPLGRVSYSVHCHSEPSWQSRVTAQIQLWLPVVVASRAIARDEVMTEDLLRLELVELRPSRLQVELQLTPLLGLKAKRRISAGQTVSRHQLEAALLVEKGQQVIIEVQTEGFSATTLGIALESGSLKQRIKVKNLSSGKELEAEIVDEDTVRTLFKKD